MKEAAKEERKKREGGKEEGKKPRHETYFGGVRMLRWCLRSYNFLLTTLNESEKQHFLISLVSNDKPRGGRELERARGDIKENPRASVPKRGVVVDRDRHFNSIN